MPAGVAGDSVPNWGQFHVSTLSSLTVGQSFALFNQFAKARNMPALKRHLFKGMMAEVIRDAYGVGVRIDLKNPETEKQKCGWKGLRPVSLSA